MRCSTCQTQNTSTARFCEQCGARLARACPRCGHEVNSTARFCPECGQALASIGTADDAITAPEAYTPRHLAEKIRSARGALEGERKQVTVLFADVFGSTELIRDLDAEDAQRLLDGAVQRMMEAVHRYEGTVSRLMGDGLMALFGAPVAHEDHALRACYAALAMQDALRPYAQEIRRTYGSAVEIRVGLNSGEVVVRLISDDLHMDYTAMGQTVHLAARMEQAAAPGTVLLSPETHRLVEGYVDVRPLGPVAVKGLLEPVEVAELVGVHPVRTRLQAASSRGLSRFVGRQAEIEIVSRALDRARGGHGQVVAMVGEPGVGKSRLVWELTHAERTRDWLVLESGSVSYGKATAWLPVINLLKAYWRIEPRDGEQAILEKVAARPLRTDSGPAPAPPSLLTLLDVPIVDPTWESLDPPQRRRQTLEAVRLLLLSESRLQPLFLVFEDLHWIDSETEALLDSLVESLPTARILLLVNYRPEYEHRWGSRTYYTQLRIDPLQADGADELLGALLGDDHVLQPLKRLLIEATDGNPLFLEESVRALIEAGTLVGDHGAYRLTRPVESVRVPASVQAVLAARIDRLEPDVKRLLQTAAVIGKDVSFSLLQAIADLAEDELQAHLSHLQTAELLYQTSLFPELEYTFKHALTHEVAYGSLLQERRRTTHARIVEVIERLDADRLAEAVEQLAYHALRGEVWEKALRYAWQSGTKAAHRSAHRDAVVNFERALAALQHVPATLETREQAIDVRLDLRSSLYPLGEFERIIARLREAETIAETLDDRGRLARVSAYLASAFFTTGRYATAIESAERTATIAASSGDLGARVLGNHYLGLSYYCLGAFAEASELLTWNVESLTGELTFARFGLHGVAAVFSLSPLVWSLAERGEFTIALRHGEEQVRIAEAADHPYTLGAASIGVGLLHLRRGDLERAITVGERGVELSRTWEIRSVLPVIAAELGYAYALSGRAVESTALLSEAVELSAALASTMNHALAVGWLGEALLLAGRPVEATEQAARALYLARQRHERGAEAWALRLGGEIASRQSPDARDRSEATYREALALADELEMRPLQAHCHLGLGKLYRRNGCLDEARAELSTAASMLREMGMTFWLPEAEAELAAIRVS